MKRVIFGAALAALVLSANAQTVVDVTTLPADDALVNEVYNGDFEGEYSQKPQGNDWYFTYWIASKIEEWAIQTPGEWSCSVCVRHHDDSPADEYAQRDGEDLTNVSLEEGWNSDEDDAPERPSWVTDENNNYFLAGYHKDNGYGDATITQTLYLDGGKEYTLDFMIKASVECNLDSHTADNHMYGVRLINPTNTSADPYFEIKHAGDANGEWQAVKYTFTAPDDDHALQFVLSDNTGESSAIHSTYMKIDNVRVYASENGEPSGVKNVAVAAGEREVYNLQGMRVRDNGQLRGIYLVKENGKTRKVAL